MEIKTQWLLSKTTKKFNHDKKRKKKNSFDSTSANYHFLWLLKMIVNNSQLSIIHFNINALTGLVWRELQRNFIFIMCQITLPVGWSVSCTHWWSTFFAMVSFIFTLANPVSTSDSSRLLCLTYEGPHLGRCPIPGYIDISFDIAFKMSVTNPSPCTLTEPIGVEIFGKQSELILRLIA